MIDAARTGCLKLEKLEAMTAVCSVGLDMIVCPGDTPAEVIARSLPTKRPLVWSTPKLRQCALFRPIGKKEGEELEFGGLLGAARSCRSTR